MATRSPAGSCSKSRLMIEESLSTRRAFGRLPAHGPSSRRSLLSCANVSPLIQTRLVGPRTVAQRFAFGRQDVHELGPLALDGLHGDAELIAHARRDPAVDVGVDRRIAPPHAPHDRRAASLRQDTVPRAGGQRAGRIRRRDRGAAAGRENNGESRRKDQNGQAKVASGHRMLCACPGRRCG